MLKDDTLYIYTELKKRFEDANLHRPMRIERYEAGTELEYDATGVAVAASGRVRLVIDKFVGGGFAGQVYRVKILGIESESGTIGDLRVGGLYAMKILIPPSGFSQLFRNTLYWIGFQGPFRSPRGAARRPAGADSQLRAASRRPGCCDQVGCS